MNILFAVVVVVVVVVVVETVVVIGLFEVFTAVVMKSIIFWDMRPCSPLSFNRRFGGTYRLHLQDRRNTFRKTASKQVASGNSTDYTASYPRR
jgi:hypothetical protein